MGVDYDFMADLARQQIEENGTKCVLKNPSGNPPVYNPATNEYETDDKLFDGFCIVSGYEDQLVDGTVIIAGDRKIIAVLDGKPVPSLSKLEVYDKDDKLKDTYLIVNSTPIDPNASVVIVYKLHCRK
jgi:hypothetical protein